MQLAETEKEMSFDLIQSELQISENEVEAFIIDGNFVLYFDFSSFLVAHKLDFPGFFFQVFIFEK